MGLFVKIKFVKIKTVDLVGLALDWAVAKCEDKLWLAYENALFNETVLPARPSEYLRDNFFGPEFSPSTNWAQGGPIIEREITKLFKNVGGTHTAQIRHEETHSLISRNVLAGWTNASGPTPLIAAMRCYVASKLGDAIDILDDLVKGPTCT